MKTFSITDVGMVRQVNQDYVFTTGKPLGILQNLFVVADGMGGHQAGDYASKCTVEVMIKDIHDTKIALSLKFPETNPWANAAEDYAVGTVITGKVARMTDFGAFVELAPGVDALLHVSQISREHVEKPSDVLSVGQEITAKIVDLNEADKKISLSMKALLDDAEPQEEATEE